MNFKSITLTAAALILSTNVSAELLGRLPTTPGGTNYQAYYDNEADLTWLTGANANGLMNWDDAKAWAAGLDVAGVTGWRLPDTVQLHESCNNQSRTRSHGSNCTGSKRGNTAGSLSNIGPFSNVQSKLYWTATEYANLSTNAWYFRKSNGSQYDFFNYVPLPAWPVHSGDVSAVPLPAAVWLFCSGLIGLIGFARGKAYQ